MSNQFSLDDIKAAAEKKYGSTKIKVDEETTVELLNVLRLPKEKRAVVTGINKKLEEVEGDVDAQADLLVEALRAVCASKAGADKLIAALNGDLAQIMQTFEFYTSETEAGEASGSQS